MPFLQRRSCIVKNRVLKDGMINKSHIFRYLHFSLCVVGHKLFSVQTCSMAGQKFICSGQKWPSSHAEINAIKCLPFHKLKNPKFCRKVVVYVCRFDPTEARLGNFVMIDSKPCAHCLEVMHRFNIDKIEYSTSKDGLFTKDSVSTLMKNHDFVVSHGHKQK